MHVHLLFRYLVASLMLLLTVPAQGASSEDCLQALKVYFRRLEDHCNRQAVCNIFSYKKRLESLKTAKEEGFEAEAAKARKEFHETLMEAYKTPAGKANIEHYFWLMVLGWKYTGRMPGQSKEWTAVKDRVTSLDLFFSEFGKLENGGQHLLDHTIRNYLNKIMSAAGEVADGVGTPEMIELMNAQTFELSILSVVMRSRVTTYPAALDYRYP